jgi:Carboxypeptidase regulatory-like domain/TonB dependent receptor
MVARMKQLATAIVLALLAGTILHGQQNLGSISGIVRDPSGAVVPRAELTLQRQETGAEIKLLSGADGAYTFPALHVGTYSIRVTLSGFKTAEAKDLRVVAGESLSVDFTLELGQVAQVTTVTAAAPLVDTKTNTLGTTRTVEEIKDLPLEMAGQARTYLGWFLTVPGYAYIPSQSWATYNGLTRANINGVGTSQFANDYYGYNLDGVSGISFANAGLEDAAAPIPDVIEEFRLSTNPPAESGANLGVQVDLVMKSGTNDFHGTLFEYFRNDHLNARNWFLPIVPPLKQNQYGFTLGGPLSLPRIYNGKNRSFFFASWMGERMRSLPTGSDVNGTVTSVPTKLMQQGNFSEWLGPQVGTDALGRPVFQGEVFDPSTTRTVSLPAGGTAVIRDPFPNNTMPAASISPVSAAFAKYLPLPNAPGLQLNYFAFSTKRHTDEDLVMFKVDHQLRENQRLSFAGDILPNKYVNYEAQFPAQINNSECVNQSLRRFRAVYSWMARPDLLFNFRASYIRSVWDDRPSLCVNTSADYGATAGLKGVLAPYTPLQNITGIATFGNSWNIFLRIGTHVPINTDLTLTRGSHNLKWGAEFDQQIHLNDESILTAGQFSFGPLETGLPGFAQTGLGFASYLLGAVDSATLNTPVIVRHLARRWGVYAQDQWRATRKLTLNYGLRWDIVNPLWESHDRIGAFDPTVPNPAAGGRLGALSFWGTGPGRNGKSGSLYPIYWTALGPRLGLAYAFNEKTVFRAYYGLLYSPMNADFVQGESIPALGSSASVTPTTLDNGVSPAFNWNTGFPNIIPSVPNFNPSQLNGSSVPYLGSPRENRPARSQNLGASLERTLPGDVLLKAAYVGTLTHGYRSTDGGPPLDQLPLQYLILGNLLLQSINSAQARAAGIPLPYAGFTGSVAQALRPYPQYTGVSQSDSTYGFSLYHALQATAQKRFRQGLNFLVTYTFSKDLVNGSYQALPLLNTRKALGSLDRTNVVNLSYSYQLPFGPGKPFLQNSHGVVRQIVEGWQVSAIQSYYSGTPVVVSTSASIPGIGGVWANRVPGVPISTGVGCESYNPGDPTSHLLNINAFSSPVAFTFGNTRVLPSTRLCGYRNEDVSIQKSFSLKEHVDLRFGFDFYNVFNRHDWGFASTAGGGGLGTNINQPASFGRYSGTSDPRTIQIYARLEF